MDIDDKIKEIIKGVGEAPDSFVWERINSTLNFRAKRRLYFRRGAYSVASAAAVALLLFINFDDKTLNHKTIEVIPSDGITSELKQTPVETLSSGKTVVALKTKRTPIAVIPAESLIVSSENTENQKPTVTEPQQEASAQNLVKDEQISKESEHKTESKKPETLKRTFRNTIADAVMPSVKKSRSKINMSAYAHLNTSYKNNTTNMYAPGIDLDDSKTFMAPGTQFYIESDVKYSVPTQFGVQVQIPINNRYSVSTGLTYSYLKSEVITTPTGGESNTKVVTQLQYIGLPVNVFYNLITSKNLKVYANIGGMIEKGIDANVIVSGMGIADSEISSTIKPLALSVNGGFGIEYLFNRHLGLYADPGLTYFFETDQPISIRTVEQLQFKCEVGLRLHL